MYQLHNYAKRRKRTILPSQNRLLIAAQTPLQSTQNVILATGRLSQRDAQIYVDLENDKIQPNLEFASSSADFNNQQVVLIADSDVSPPNTANESNANIGYIYNTTKSQREICSEDESPIPESLDMDLNTNLPEYPEDSFQQFENIDADDQDTDEFDESVKFQTANTTDEDCNFKAAKKSLRIVLTWGRMISFLCISGKIRFTAKQYEVFAAAIKTATEGQQTLCTYKTVRSGSQWSFLKSTLFPYSKVYFIDKNTTKGHRIISNSHQAYAHIESPNLEGVNHVPRDSRDCVRLVLPSEWAKLDLLTLPVYKYLYTEHNGRGNSMSIEDSPFVQDNNRSLYIGGRYLLWVQHMGTIIPSDSSDNLVITCGHLKHERTEEEADEWVSSFNTGSQSFSFNCTVGPSWCVHGRNSTPSESEVPQDFLDDELKLYTICTTSTHNYKDLNSVNSSKPPKFRNSASRSHNSRAHQTQQTTPLPGKKICFRYIFLFPGDVCTILRPPLHMTSNYICLLIGSFVYREKGRVGERCVWINRSSLLRNTTSTETFFSVPVSLWSPVLLIPAIAQGFKPKSIIQERNNCNQGILEDGSRYFIYRLILYSDGFNQKKSLTDNKSVCGIYMMPAGLPLQCRCSSTSVRPLTLASHGQDPNDLMQPVIDDIILGITKGFQAFTPFGEKVKVFLDPIALFGDYPAVSACTDVSGHTSDTFCSFCSITKRKGGNEPEILYSTKLHSRRTSLTRFDERMRIVRSEEPDPSIRKHLGTSCKNEKQASSLFAIRLAEAVRKSAPYIPRSITGDTIFDASFDSHLSAAAAPDHLFKGLISNVLTVCFDFLPNDDSRHKADALICSYIQEFKLPSIDTILKWEKHGKYKGLNNLTTSALFSALLFAGPVFEDIHSYSVYTVSPLLLPSSLQRIVSLMYWWPHHESDTSSSLHYVSGGSEKPLKYHGDILRLCEEYMNDIKNYYIYDGRFAKVLDKPNAHRLLELAVHTIPMFKHASNVSELVLEMVHRVFKDWLERNSHDDSHLTAVELAISKDWSSRVYALLIVWNETNIEMEREAAEFGLRRLLLGEATLKLDTSEDEFKSLISDFRKALVDAFKQPVLSQLRGSSRMTLLHVVEEKWVPFKRIRTTSIEQQRSLQLLTTITISDSGSDSFEFYEGAKMTKKEEFSGSRCASTHTTIFKGNIVSSVITGNLNSAIITPSTSGNGSTTFLRVFHIVKALSEDQLQEKVWLVVKEVTKAEDNFTSNEYLLPSLHDGTIPLHIINLTSSTRKVAALHICSAHCKFRESEGRTLFNHDEDAIRYRILASRDGFPPHMG